MPKDIRAKSHILAADRTIKIGSNTLSKIAPNNTSTNIVLHGTGLGSNIGHKLNRADLNNIYLTPLLQEILIGIILGDGNIRKP
jgi:hypothetical protein